MTSRPSQLEATDSSGTCSEELLTSALARIGRLEASLATTGGTLHDVNNLLTVLSGNLYLLTEAVRNHPSLYSKSRRARNTAERASALIRELLVSSRDPIQGAAAICPAKHVLALEPSLCRAIDSKHELTISHGDSPWSVSASAAQLESAVANLVLNAHEALSEPGRIQVVVENICIGVDHAEKLEIDPGEYVCVQVRDNGVGIPASTLSRITEPLYTSKPAGQGSGMGLTMVQRFAAHCGGALRIQSVEGHGTIVRLWLPRCESKAEETANMTLPLSTLPGGHETVLLITRDPEARVTVKQLLDALGYSVMSTGDRARALDFARTQTDISLIVCERADNDLEADRKWLDTIRSINPDIRHLAILGPETDLADSAPDADAYLRYPVAVADLAETVREALGD